MGDSIGDAEQYPPSVAEMDELTKVFNRFDVDGDGRISAAELKSVLGALGSCDTSDAEIRVMIAEMDSDNDGFVDLREFAAFHLGEKGKGPRGCDVELRDAFDLYDLDKNGLISAAELHLVLQKLGERCSVKDCERMIGSVDSDGDGSVSFGEFKKMMGKKGSN